MVEQKPSEEVMRRVVPSEDLGVGVSDGGKLGLGRGRGDVPGQIGESGEVKIADDAEGSLLLSVVDENGVLGCNGVDDAVR